MFWILRRTGAVNFLSSLNGNCRSSKGSNNGTNDKCVKRPPRKAYGRLSADSDDCVSISKNIDDSSDNLDHFDMTEAHKTNPSGGNNNQLSTKTNGKSFDVAEDDNKNLKTSDCLSGSCKETIIFSNVCDLDEMDLANDSENENSLNDTKHKVVNQNTIHRLHAIAMAEDDDYDEALTCNVCDRAFACRKQLASHQQKKRHFCCSSCDSLFPSLMLLEHHKEEFEHWSDEEINRRVCCRHGRGDDYFTDTDSFTSEAESEDLERLL